jgi:isopentenyl phosphate kinase
MDIEVHSVGLYLLDGCFRTCYIFPMLVFLKLGGSLITDKNRPYTPRLEKLDDLIKQVAQVLKKDGNLKLILGHGSGSFGHQAAIRFDTRRGVSGMDAWNGFAEVWYQASRLNRFVMESLHKNGLPAITLSPVSSVIANHGDILSWDLSALKISLENGLLPVVHGDVVFDGSLGGTILSTEYLFAYLAHKLEPKRILLAGLETGVWKDFPSRKHLIKEMTPVSFKKDPPGMLAAGGPDVTGGMQGKISQMLVLIEKLPELEVLVFSGEKPGAVFKALQGENPGTLLHG